MLCVPCRFQGFLVDLFRVIDNDSWKVFVRTSQQVSNEENIRSCVGGDNFFFEVIQALTKKCVYEGFAKQA